MRIQKLEQKMELLNVQFFKMILQSTAFKTISKNKEILFFLIN